MVTLSETLDARIQDLRTFCTVVDEGSLAAAARRLGVTKGSVSRRIARLEGLVGFSLFDRGARASLVTVEGATFHDYARRAVTLLDDGIAIVTDSNSDTSGDVRISAPTDFALSVLPPVLGRFSDLYPAINTVLNASDSFMDLTNDRIDIAVRLTRSDRLPDMDYAAVGIGAVRMGLYCAPATLANRPIRRPEDLGTLKCLALACDLQDGSVLLEDNDRTRIQVPVRRDALSAGDYASLAQLLTVRRGFGLLPALVARPMLDTGTLVRVLPDWFPASGYVWAVTRPGKALPGRVRTCRDYLVTSLKQAIQREQNQGP